MQPIVEGRVSALSVDSIEVLLEDGSVVRCDAANIAGFDTTVESRTLHVGQSVEVLAGATGAIVRVLRPVDWTHQAEQRTCMGCSASFWLTPGERRWFDAKELSLPRRCPACRAVRRDLKTSAAVAAAVATQERR